LSASLGRHYPTVFASLANVRGSAKRSRLPPSTLNKVSRRTNGNFYDIYDFNDIYDIYDFYEIPITSIKMEV